MKKLDRNHVKLQDFIIFKDKLGLQLSPVYIIGKFTLINTWARQRSENPTPGANKICESPGVARRRGWSGLELTDT